MNHPTIEPKVNSRRSFQYNWITSGGILMILFGIIALAVPVATSVALGWLLGLVFLAAGISQLFHTFQSWREPGKISRFLLAGLSIVAGIITLRRPFAGMIAITLILSFYLIAGGVGKWLFASEVHPNGGWGWIAFSLIISIVLGIALVVWLPVNSLVAPAIFLGVDLIFFGSSVIAFGAASRRLAHEIAPEEMPPSKFEKKKPFKAA